MMMRNRKGMRLASGSNSDAIFFCDVSDNETNALQACPMIDPYQWPAVDPPPSSQGISKEKSHKE
jgi:hypothetical protein